MMIVEIFKTIQEGDRLFERSMKTQVFRSGRSVFTLFSHCFGQLIHSESIFLFYVEYWNFLGISHQNYLWNVRVTNLNTVLK